MWVKEHIYLIWLSNLALISSKKVCGPSFIAYTLILNLIVTEHGRNVLFFENPIEIPTGLEFMIIVDN